MRRKRLSRSNRDCKLTRLPSGQRNVKNCLTRWHGDNFDYAMHVGRRKGTFNRTIILSRRLFNNRKASTTPMRREGRAYGFNFLSKWPRHGLTVRYPGHAWCKKVREKVEKGRRKKSQNLFSRGRSVRREAQVLPLICHES